MKKRLNKRKAMQEDGTEGVEGRDWRAWKSTWWVRRELAEKIFFWQLCLSLITIKSAFPPTTKVAGSLRIMLWRGGSSGQRSSFCVQEYHISTQLHSSPFPLCAGKRLRTPAVQFLSLPSFPFPSFFSGGDGSEYMRRIHEEDTWEESGKLEYVVWEQRGSEALKRSWEGMRGGAS